MRGPCLEIVVVAICSMLRRLGGITLVAVVFCDGDLVFSVEPPSEVDQLAPLRAERVRAWTPALVIVGDR